ncbi:caspase recruitment domain-containing protein 19 isoform 4-T8 [Phoenicopterus ruber ruber]
MADQSYCHRLQHDMYFLTSNSRLNEQVVDKIILQLNRVYPQILTNAEAEKFRNPKASLHTRLSDLIKHLQKKGDRHCQEFYRALQINAEQLYNDLPSRKVLSPKTCVLRSPWEPAADKSPPGERSPPFCSGSSQCREPPGDRIYKPRQFLLDNS